MEENFTDLFIKFFKKPITTIIYFKNTNKTIIYTLFTKYLYSIIKQVCLMCIILLIPIQNHLQNSTLKLLLLLNKFFSILIEIIS